MAQRRHIIPGIDEYADKEARRIKDRTAKRDIGALVRVVQTIPEAKRLYEEITGKAPVWKQTRKQPVPFNEELAEYILDLLASGMSLRRIAMLPDMPEPGTIVYWAFTNARFASQYQTALQTKAQIWADELMDIADDSSNDYVETEDDNGHLRTVFDQDHYKRTQMRIDARKWYLSKIMPKQFGDATLLKLADAEGKKLPALAPSLNIIGVTPT